MASGRFSKYEVEQIPKQFVIDFCDERTLILQSSWNCQSKNEFFFNIFSKVLLTDTKDRIGSTCLCPAAVSVQLRYMDTHSFHVCEWLQWGWVRDHRPWLQRPHPSMNCNLPLLYVNRAHWYYMLTELVDSLRTVKGDHLFFPMWQIIHCVLFHRSACQRSRT